MSERRTINDFFSKPNYCPKCNGDLYFTNAFLKNVLKCKDYHESKKQFRCSNCKFQTVMCMICLNQFETMQYKSTKSSKINRNEVLKGYFSSRFLRVILVIVLLSLIYCIVKFTIKINSENSNVIHENENLKIVDELRKQYPSQKNETWYHFLSVLEKVPTVKSIMFLHGEDKITSQHLTNELVSLYAKNKRIKMEDITFYSLGYGIKDYGIVLEHYREIVKRFRIFITDLNKVSGSIARIFHSLCDEVSSDIKPSLFIFTLMYSKGTEDLKPVERATTILKEAWKDLPENEIFPLFSRIVKNVVDIIPEEKNIL